MKPGTIIAVVAVLVIGAAAVYMHRPRPEPVETPPARVAAPAAAPVKKAEAPAPAAPEPARKAPKKAAPPPVAVAAPAAPTTATLILETDVPGASVFINREYVGTTPLKLEKLEPGEKQLKLTADGYEGLERKVELALGDNPVTLRFREVRLNQKVTVTHKHGIGSCDGTLVATVDGLSYETANKNDAFKLGYAQLETFAVDYLDKNLKVKQKGGKQWNFTDKTATNADRLFVFHKEVESARKKLADGFAPVR